MSIPQEGVDKEEIFQTESEFQTPTNEVYDKDLRNLNRERVLSIRGYSQILRNII